MGGVGLGLLDMVVRLQPDERRKAPANRPQTARKQSASLAGRRRTPGRSPRLAPLATPPRVYIALSAQFYRIPHILLDRPKNSVYSSLIERN